MFISCMACHKTRSAQPFKSTRVVEVTTCILCNPHPMRKRQPVKVKVKVEVKLFARFPNIRLGRKAVC